MMDIGSTTIYVPLILSSINVPTFLQKKIIIIIKLMSQLWVATMEELYVHVGFLFLHRPPNYISPDSSTKIERNLT